MRIFKNIIFSMVVVTLFFAFLEIQQRVRYYLRSKDIEYLCYGHTGFEIHLENFLFRVKNAKRKFDNRHTSITDKKTILKIDAFGGSTTNYSKIKFEFNYPQQLERLIKEKYPNLLVEVTNRGVPGANSGMVLRNMQVAYRRFNNIPDILVIYSGLNDALRLCRYKQKAPESHEIVVYEYMPIDFMARLDLTLRKYSLFYLCLKEYIVKVKYGDINRYYSAIRNKERRIEYAMSPKDELRYIDDVILKDYRKNLKSIIYLCRTLAITPIFGTIPTSPVMAKEYPTELKTLERIFDIMRETARENNVVLVDVRRYFASLKDIDYYFLRGTGDRIHVNEDGNAIVAGLFLKALEENKLLIKDK